MRHSGGIPAVVVLTSATLDLAKDNSTCELFQAYEGKEVFFRRVDKDVIFKGTPIQKFYQEGAFERSKTPIVHYSDAIRLILIHRYGGWYSDLDMIVLQSLKSLPNNAIASDQVFL